jgi:CelD/BcsL family acetyltransferase involved in cellulose biosynthesis
MAKKEVFCEWCRKEIKKGEKAAGMHTYREFPQISDERFFHFDCFLDWKDNKIKEAGINAFKKSMPKMAPLIRSTAERIAEDIKTKLNNEEETKKITIC